MKNLNCFLLILCFICLRSNRIFAQTGQNEFEKKRISGEINDVIKTKELIDAFNVDNDDVFKIIKEILNANSASPLLQKPIGASDPEFKAIQGNIIKTLDNIDNGENAAVILVYRKFSIVSGGTTTYIPDLANVYTKIYHRKKKGSNLSGYLLSTRKIYVIFADAGDEYYKNDVSKTDSKLSASTIKTVRKDSYLKQSLTAMGKVWGAMGATSGTDISLTIVELQSNRIKNPCDITISNKTFKADIIYTIHEQNAASFQVGLINNKLTTSDFSITGGNLVVKPSEDEQSSWKSHAIAMFELHLPRDIDNFKPLWTSVFKKNEESDKRTIGEWLHENLISRIGIYGGVKISKDPLSDLYAGFNFAITKELAINFGLDWSNEYQNQITEVGNITSLDDALKYAKRKYGTGRFAIGISFSPQTVIEDWGLK